MGINATLFGQFITFFLFIAFTVKFVWPHITRAMEERKERISDGLAAAERGRRELAEADEQKKEVLREAREQAKEILDQANRRSNEIVDQAKARAREEGDRLVEAARSEIDQEANRAREELRREVARIAVAGAGRILEREIDADAHRKLLDELATEL